MQYFVNNNQSINKILEKMNEFDTLHLSAGIYREKIKIITKNITIIGEARETTIIENMDYSTKIHLDNSEYNTFRTYTLLVMSDNVSIENITIKNLATPSSIYGQAVALHVLGNNFTIKNCNILGAQDTILCGPIPGDLVVRYQNFLPADELAANKPSKQLYESCFISGDIDFIFGCGNAIFYKCTINSIDNQNTSYITAPAHTKEQPHGFTFIECSLIGEALENSVFLARPWRDYGRSVFINCLMGKHINELGWNKWGTSNRDKTCFFAEYSPDNDTTKRLSFGHILTEQDLLDYTIEKIHKE